MEGIIFIGIEEDSMSGFGVGNNWLCAVEYLGGGLCGPAGCRVRRPPHILVLFLLREFGLGKAFLGGRMQDIEWGFFFCFQDFWFSAELLCLLVGRRTFS